MALATLLFWIGRHRYERVSPTPWREYVQDLFEPSSRRALWHLAFLFVAVAAFWALFDQTGSSWVLQAEHMDREVSVPFIGSFSVLPSQIQALNPLLILILTPAFAWGLYPRWGARGLFSLRGRVVFGIALAGVSFGIVALSQYWLGQGMRVSIGWQLLAYVVLTVSEVMVSVTTLELTYTHSPRVSKSFVTSFYLLSVSLGNGFAALYNGYMTQTFGGPETVSYFVFFAVLPVVASIGAWVLLDRLRSEWMAGTQPSGA
jgi:POT family proton-dependent oligopeptide transporter